MVSIERFISIFYSIAPSTRHQRQNFRFSHLGKYIQSFCVHSKLTPSPIYNQFQLKEKIATIEKQLVNEQRKTEDLQFSIDEATFCSDELNVSTNTDRHASAFVCISDVDSPLDAPTFISRNIVFFCIQAQNHHAFVTTRTFYHFV